MVFHPRSQVAEQSTFGFAAAGSPTLAQLRVARRVQAWRCCTNAVAKLEPSQRPTDSQLAAVGALETLKLLNLSLVKRVMQRRAGSGLSLPWQPPCGASPPSTSTASGELPHFLQFFFSWQSARHVKPGRLYPIAFPPLECAEGMTDELNGSWPFERDGGDFLSCTYCFSFTAGLQSRRRGRRRNRTEHSKRITVRV